MSGLLERKDSLKEELADCQEKLEQWKSKYKSVPCCRDVTTNVTVPASLCIGTFIMYQNWLQINVPSPPCSKLKVQWEEKVVVLGGLEESMGKLQESFSQREATLVREKEAALEELRSVGIIITITYMYCMSIN